MSELRRAAEAFIEWDDVTNNEPVPKHLYDDLRAALSAPDELALDNEPVTEEWLRSILNGETEAKLGWGFRVSFYECMPPDLAYDNGAPAHGYGHDHSEMELPACKTRGAVRRLCAALGIELTEPPCTH